MSAISLGDMARTFALRRQNTDLKAEQHRLSTEMTTGLVADSGKHLRGDFSGVAAMDASLSRLEAYKPAQAMAAGVASGMQAVLGTVGALAGDLATTLSDPKVSGLSSVVDIAGREAAEGFQAAVSLFNTRYADQSLFAGTVTQGTALASADAMLDALQTATAGAVSAADLEGAVNAWFDDPDGYAAFYGGGAPRGNIALGAEDRVSLGVTALDPAIRDTLKGMALGALLDRGVFAGDSAARSQVALRAGAALVASSQSRIGLEGRIGVAEARIEASQTRATSEISALKIARTAMLSADPYETAVRLTAVETQIETLNTVTARLSKLSLAGYL